MRLKLITSLLLITLGPTMLSGCSTENAYTGEKQTSSATKGAVLGAIGGAFLGILTGSNQNAAIGAVLGAGIGGAIGHEQDKQEAALRQQLRGTGVQIQREGDTIRLIMSGDISFASNQVVISPQFQPLLNSVAIVLTKFPDNYVFIAGYTDNVGSASYNLKISNQRAAAVRNYLQAQGIDSVRLVNVGYGEGDPIASNATAEGQAQNRRVEISLMPIPQ